MTDTESHPKKKRRPPIFIRILILLMGVLILAYFSVFFGFNYFGEKFLRKYLKERIARISQGLYDVDFGKLTLNILNGKLTIQEFEMLPDTVLYREMKTKGLIRKSLYRFSFKSLSIDRLNFLQIYSQRRINLRQVNFLEPVISIVGFPDTVTARKGRWRVIYEDIYPMISMVFNDFHVDSITIDRGLLLTSFRQKTGRLTLGEYEFSSILRDVSVNPFSYYNRERVFYSRDIDWIIHNLELSLGDSLYFLKADQIGFSLVKSKLWGKQLSLTPNFNSARFKSATAGDFFQLNIPDFFIEGVDLYKALVDKEAGIKNVQLKELRFKMFRNNKPDQPIRLSGKRKKLRTANVYTIITGALKSVTIDSFSVKKATFEYFRDIRDPNPELRIAEVDLDLSNFYLDSLAHRNKNKIYYSDNIELLLRNISLKLRDGIHFLNSEEIRFSTAKSLIDIQYSILFSDKKVNLLSKAGPKNLISCLLPGMIFYNVDLKKVFNKRILDFDRLEIKEPDLVYTKYHKSKNPDPRFKTPADFFQEENEEVFYDLLKKYLTRIRGNSIRISHGQLQLRQQHEETEKKIASCSFDLTMQDFLIDSVHGMNRQGYFYSRDFTLDVNSLVYKSPDTSRRLEIERLHVNTNDSLIEAYHCSFTKTTSEYSMENEKINKPTLDYDFTFKELRVSGLNHKKLFLENILKASTIILEKPILQLEAGEERPRELPADKPMISRSSTFPGIFEIGRFIVRNGALSFDGREEQKVTYFSLKDVDFGITDAVVHVPEKGKTKGLIRFDSLQLSVFPINIILSDSAYAFQCFSLTAHSYPANIIATGVKINPLKKAELAIKPNNFITTDIPTVTIKGFYFDKAIFDKQWYMDEIGIEEPVFFIEERITGKRKTESKTPSPGHNVKLPLFMKSLNVGKTRIKNGSLNLKLITKDTLKSYSLSNINVTADRLRIDSLTQAIPGSAPVFFCEDVSLSSNGYKWISKDSMYTYAYTGFGFSTLAQQAYVDSFTMTPNLSRFDFCRKVGHQVDRLVLKIPRINLEYLDFQKLVHDQEIYSGRITLEGMTFESYRDKRVPFPKSQRPPLPAQMIKSIKIPLTIDTVILTNGNAVYEEQTKEQPGRIFFDQMNATLINLSTDTLRRNRPMNVHGTSYLMGKALVEASFHIPMNSDNDTFSIIAHIGEMNLQDINPMISNLLPVNIRKGTITNTEIKQIHANNDLAKGYMLMHFQNIKIELLSTEPGTLNKWETALKTLVANWILPDSNPKEDGKTRHGYIYYERDKSKGFFNFVWKSTLSGIKSSVGLNSKEQKELKKTDKKNRK